jgi:hypothetical protein
MSAEQEVVANLRKHLSKKYEFPKRRNGNIKEFGFANRYDKNIKFDIFAYKIKRNDTEILLIECKGKTLRSLAQGYGQIIYYRTLFGKPKKEWLRKKFDKLGIDNRAQKNIKFGFAYHSDAYKSYRKILTRLANYYAYLGIRTYIVSKSKVRIIREKSLPS